MKAGLLWRIVRASTQIGMFVLVVLTPLLGGWQRVDAPTVSAWDNTPAADLPSWVSAELNSTTGDRLNARTPLRGSAVGVELLGLSFIDPVAGFMGLLRATPTVVSTLALLLPLLLALLLGRVFCGWLCPFGALSRLVRVLVDRLPFAPRGFELGPRRPLRWILLVACLVAGAFGSQLVVTLALPHLALGQSFGHMWLEGGGGAVTGWLLGIVAVGVVFGPTVYCAALCPTGAVLGLAGRFRPVRLRIADTGACPPACRRCDMSCWLALHPATGDAGQDCDNCQRCASACPRDNLRVGLGRGARRALPVVGALLLFSSTAAAEANVQPRLVLDAEQEIEGVNVALGILDLSAVRLNADTSDVVGGSEVTIRLSRGPRAADDERGREGAKEHYEGSLVLEVRRAGVVLERVEMEAPNAPRSTVNRRLYTVRIDRGLEVGDRVIVDAPDWSTNASFDVGDPRAGGDTVAFFWTFLIAVLAVGAALSLALALSGGPSARGDRKPAAKPA